MLEGKGTIPANLLTMITPPQISIKRTASQALGSHFSFFRKARICTHGLCQGHPSLIEKIQNVFNELSQYVDHTIELVGGTRHTRTQHINVECTTICDGGTHHSPLFSSLSFPNQNPNSIKILGKKYNLQIGFIHHSEQKRTWPKTIPKLLC